ncbi:response regulator transcription factor [Streptomyces sp. NPDC056149]|uniref:response regulator transcription factor n=1 Tax=Streptomyces sp. NPDC056149 TaxID=3345728 RepID=UPI0035DABF30
MRILFAHDDSASAQSVVSELRRHAMAVDFVHRSDEAERLSNCNNYDVVVLDQNLPTIGGYEMCRSLFGHDDPPLVLLLTVDQVEDRVRGLRAGADDCLSKPFAFVELVTRIRVLSRRRRAAAPLILRHGGIALDPARREVRVRGRLVRLTPKEFAVLQLLLEAQGQPIAHEELLATIWDTHMDSRTNTVRTTVSRLRHKLGRPNVICVDNGKGYRLNRAMLPDPVEPTIRDRRRSEPWRSGPTEEEPTPTEPPPRQP